MDFVFDYGFGYSAFQIIFYLIFAIVIGCFIVTAVRGIRTWHKNNNSPRLTVHATVVSKRQNTSVHHHHNDNTAMHTSTSTSYYATFQFDSGDRLELHVSGPDYGLLAEGDTGDLTFQGTRYLGFDRRAAGPTPEDELSTDAPHRPTEKKSWDPEL